MTLGRHYQQAWINLSAAKLRSLLAVLGILVGTAAVVALMSCGQLATEKALEQFKALGTDLLAVSAFQQDRRAEKNANNEIPLAEWRNMAHTIEPILKIAPYTTTYQLLSFQGKILQGAIIGADESLARIVQIKLAQGHFVSFINSFERVCVIGDGIAKQMRQQSLDSPLGKQLRVGQLLYTIIGVALPWKENGFFNEDINQSIIIPTKSIKLISKDSQVNNAVLLLKPNSPIDDVIKQITQKIHGLAPQLTVYSRSAKQIIEGMQSQGRIFTLLLAVIGGISLVVGGIGIMNVMLVSVSERKKEIGIRKAVGARDYEIRTLFLVESILLSLLGGTLGIFLGLIFTWVVAYFSAWPYSIPLLPPLAGFIVSVATGIFFGFYPAHRAAKLEPIVSLRL